MALNEKYSGKDFTNKQFTETDPEEWNDTIVKGSCFYQNEPRTEVFPSGIRGVTFLNCNLDNVVVPKECTVEGGTHKLIAVQNDQELWYVDEDLNPIKPVNEYHFVKLGLSTNPLDIPAVKISEPRTLLKRDELEGALKAQKDALDAAADSWRK